MSGVDGDRSPRQPKESFGNSDGDAVFSDQAYRPLAIDEIASKTPVVSVAGTENGDDEESLCNVSGHHEQGSSLEGDSASESDGEVSEIIRFVFVFEEWWSSFMLSGFVSLR